MSTVLKYMYIRCHGAAAQSFLFSSSSLGVVASVSAAFVLFFLPKLLWWHLFSCPRSSFVLSVIFWITPPTLLR